MNAEYSVPLGQTHTDPNGRFQLTLERGIDSSLKASAISPLGVKFFGSTAAKFRAANVIRLYPKVHSASERFGLQNWMAMDSAIRKIVVYHELGASRAFLSLDQYRASKVISSAEHQVFSDAAEAMQVIKSAHPWYRIEGLGYFKFRDSASPIWFEGP
jgi:hypothetical protein